MTSSIFDPVAAGVEVLDIEQIVLRRRLVLGVLRHRAAGLEELWTPSRRPPRSSA